MDKLEMAKRYDAARCLNRLMENDLEKFISHTHSLIAAWESGNLAQEINHIREFSDAVNTRYFGGKA